jgi:3-oxoacyl-[acyl-carrier-protein] synthase-3
MPQAHFKSSCIKAISVATGEILRRIDDEAENFAGSVEQLERIKKTIGLNERRVASPGTTAADLCELAAVRLMEKTQLDRSKIDGLICVTQTPDHFQPCNAAILHGRLGLEKHCAAFDINLGCSGWVVGLYVAFLMVEAGGCERILLLAGDTMSKCVNPRDRAVAPLFGDAGSATLIERGATNSWFSLHTNGKGSQFIQIPCGGFRAPSSPETKTEIADEDGNVRCGENLQMNGGEVFNFSIMEEPPAIREILEFSGKSIEEIDWIVFHQANKYIIGNIARRLKAPMEKVPCGTVEKFGNQSSASIPATICSEISEQVRGGMQRMIFSGFGVGLSWASCLIESPGFETFFLIKESDRS